MSDEDPGGRVETLVLSDPSAIKALAHPARVRVIDELYDGRELTATELSALTGLSASAMSYHLRALHRWGIVAPATPAGGADGRERRWRSAARALRIDTGMTSANLSAETASLAVLLGARVQEVVDWAAGMADEPPEWQAVDNVSVSRLWLSAAETVELQRVVREAIDRYRDRRDPDRRPPGTRGVRITLVTTPAPDGEG